MTTRRTVLIGLGAALIATPALAHRSNRTETEVRIGADGSVAVVHVYHAQDAQDALFAAGLIDRPDIASLRARARLALYTAERFAISSGDVPVDLSVVGAELEGSNVYVYQTGTVEDADGPLSVSASMLRDKVRNQINSVNIIRGDRTVTLDFRGDDGSKSVA